MLQYGGFGEARGLVFWLIVAGERAEQRPGKELSASVPGVPEQLRDSAGARTYWPQGPDPGPATAHLLHTLH